VAVGDSFNNPLGHGFNHNGEALAFNPLAPGTPVARVVQKSTSAGDERDLYSVVCASVRLCVSSTPGSSEVQFNPAASAPGVLTHFAPASCPTTTQCTGSDTSSPFSALTFDPAAPGTATSTPFPPSAAATPPTYGRFSCPTTQQCTGLSFARGQAAGTEWTLDPRSSASPAPVSIPLSGFVAGFTCPTARLCVAASQAGSVVTFDPGAPTVARVMRVPGALSGLACASASLCLVTHSSSSAVVSFDPASPSGLSSASLSAFGGNGNVACPRAGECVAATGSGAYVGLTAGTVDAGTPAFGKRAARDRSAKIAVKCTGARGSSCAVTLEATATSGGVYRIDLVGTASGRIAAGHSKTLELEVNPFGQALLRRRHTVQATVLLATLGRSGTVTKRLSLAG
jgi:hypothetical protein